MRKLEVVQVARMSALGHGDNMIDARRKWVGILHTKFHGLAADATHSLGRIDLLFIPFKCKAVGTVFVWPVPLVCHAVTPPPVGMKKGHKIAPVPLPTIPSLAIISHYNAARYALVWLYHVKMLGNIHQEVGTVHIEIRATNTFHIQMFIGIAATRLAVQHDGIHQLGAHSLRQIQPNM